MLSKLVFCHVSVADCSQISMQPPEVSNDISCKSFDPCRSACHQEDCVLSNAVRSTTNAHVLTESDHYSTSGDSVTPEPPGPTTNTHESTEQDHYSTSGDSTTPEPSGHTTNVPVLTKDNQHSTPDESSMSGHLGPTTNVHITSNEDLHSTSGEHDIIRFFSFVSGPLS